ncbi:hypothetical protein WJX72_002211 [[Myrmecia] bisecta]|uniref:Uncharacterized protein n=1 Tax=[Myrmecia] bisecta TaxID=41462 RepID=A0AAW1P4H2_9CHLO
MLLRWPSTGNADCLGVRQADSSAKLRSSGLSGLDLSDIEELGLGDTGHSGMGAAFPLGGRQRLQAGGGCDVGANQSSSQPMLGGYGSPESCTDPTEGDQADLSAKLSSMDLADSPVGVIEDTAMGFSRQAGLPGASPAHGGEPDPEQFMRALDRGWYGGGGGMGGRKRPRSSTVARSLVGITAKAKALLGSPSPRIPPKRARAAPSPEQQQGAAWDQDPVPEVSWLHAC